MFCCCAVIYFFLEHIKLKQQQPASVTTQHIVKNGRQVVNPLCSYRTIVSNERVRILIAEKCTNAKSPSACLKSERRTSAKMD